MRKFLFQLSLPVRDLASALNFAYKSIGIYLALLKGGPKYRKGIHRLLAPIPAVASYISLAYSSAYQLRRNPEPKSHSSIRVLATLDTPGGVTFSITCRLVPRLPSEYEKSEANWKLGPYEQRIVAFIDILGWKAIIDKSTEVPKSAADILDRIGKGISAGTKFGSGFKSWDYQAAAFSDSIIVSVNAKCGSIGLLTGALNQIIIAMLKAGWLVRGGIAHGPMYHKGVIAFGPALSDAFELENAHAIYPRILITDTLAEQVCTAFTLNQEQDVYVQHYRKDFDGYWFLDFFLDIPSYNYGSGKNFISVHESTYGANKMGLIRKMAIEGLSTDSYTDTVKAKYVWLASHYNEIARFIPGLDLIPEELVIGNLPIKLLYDDFTVSP